MQFYQNPTLKFLRDFKRPRKAKTILKKEHDWSPHISLFQNILHSNMWHKDRYVDQWHRIEEHRNTPIYISAKYFQ